MNLVAKGCDSGNWTIHPQGGLSVRKVDGYSKRLTFRPTVFLGPGSCFLVPTWFRPTVRVLGFWFRPTVFLGPGSWFLVPTYRVPDSWVLVPGSDLVPTYREGSWFLVPTYARVPRSGIAVLVFLVVLVVVL
ncbi:hypothetical protein BV898_12986 [Hypsibius exemplaris]|uniref:Uncharacterized protein n=1 Tax=Hypsibius exemplaris TaxID=2072580 RepID=A0A1W0WC59_HYPEX|nr:hypothetical protein BV898_12986 [Hypsibius exemplaris]